jgi:Tfp pilus assembly protein PilX
LLSDRRPFELGASTENESGFALPLALSILTIVSLFVAATIGFATHNTDRAQRDRDAARALAAADAGLDAAIYRMNKAVVASQVEGVLGLPMAALAEVGCVDIDINLALIQVDDLGNGWCPESTSSEDYDGPAATETWTAANGTHQTSLGIDLDLSAASLIERKVVSTGTVGDVTKRVMGTMHLTLGSGGNLLSLFEQVGYTQCTSVPPDPSDPESGCS